MKNSDNFTSAVPDLILRLYIEKSFWQGQLNAIKLAVKYKGNVLKIREAGILLKKGELRELDISENHSDKYREGFLKGMEDSILVIDKATSDARPFHPTAIHSTRIEFELSWYSMPLTGRQDAFEFAVSCKGDIAIIKIEIEDTKKVIAEYESKGRKRTSLMKYQEGYLEGLSEALTIIEVFDQKNP